MHVQVEKNIWLHGYEADIVLRISGEYLGVDDTVVNVRSRCPSHSILFTRLAHAAARIASGAMERIIGAQLTQ